MRRIRYQVSGIRTFLHIVASVLFFSFHLSAQNPNSSPSCNAGFLIYIDSAYSKTIKLYNISNIHNLNSDERVIYHWNFGDLKTSFLNNPAHTYLRPDYYNVCLTTKIVLKADSNTVICESNYCKQTLIGNPKTFNVGGQIFAGKFPVNSGRADIFRIQPDYTINHLPAMLFDTLGYFYFFQVLEGNYILKISVSDKAYFPTYFGNSVIWSKSKKVEINKNLFSENVDLVPVKPIPGSGQIFGQLSMDNTYPGTVKNVEIILTDTNSIPLIYTFTDRSGVYNFNGIAYGTYKLFADEVGWIHPDNTLTISENKPVASAQITLKWYSSITDSQISILNSQFSINIFPVPAENTLYIDISSQKASDFKFEIYSITGTKITNNEQRITNNSRLTIDISQLSRGIYFLRITSNDISYPITKKFIKE